MKQNESSKKPVGTGQSSSNQFQKTPVSHPSSNAASPIGPMPTNIPLAGGNASGNNSNVANNNTTAAALSGNNAGAGAPVKIHLLRVHLYSVMR